MKEIFEMIDSYSAELYDQCGLTIDEILAKRGFNRYELAEAMDQTGLSIDELFA